MRRPGEGKTLLGWLTVSLFLLPTALAESPGPTGPIVDLPGPALVAVIAQLDQETPPPPPSPPDTLQIYFRSPGRATLQSMVMPGWGQWYNGHKVKGIIMAVLQVGFAAVAVWQNQRVVSATSEGRRDLYKAERSRYVWLMIGERGYSMLDAYVDAHFIGFDQDIGIQLPDEEEQEEQEEEE